VTRGDIVTVAAGSGFGSKPRPAVIIQSDRFDEIATITLCLFTSTPIELPLIRVAVLPTAENGLSEMSWLMIDKLISVRRSKLGRHIGRLSSDDMAHLDRALLIFLGLGT
jgi:mRNA interferase MazF